MVGLAVDRPNAIRQPLSTVSTRRMSTLGHKRKWCHGCVMSVLPLKADIRQREWHVRLVPLADIRRGQSMQAVRVLTTRLY
jgi:hypothetical protein